MKCVGEPSKTKQNDSESLQLDRYHTHRTWIDGRIRLLEYLLHGEA